MYWHIHWHIHSTHVSLQGCKYSMLIINLFVSGINMLSRFLYKYKVDLF